MHASSMNFPQASDPLGEALHRLRLEGSLYCRSVLHGNWSFAMPQMPGKMMFHIVTSGQCWLRLEGEEATLLEQGSLVLVPHGQGHIIATDLDREATPLFDADVQRISERYEILEVLGPGTKTEVTCGVMGFDQLAGKQLIEQLPNLVTLENLSQEREQWLHQSLAFIASEAQQLKPGGETIITHLADILVIQLIRHWLEQSPQSNTGWIGALRDKQIGAAMRAIHNQPQLNWTVETLARECGMSRSGFSARFSDLVGNSVKSYLTQWRMSLAYQQLKHQNVPLIKLAEDLGYSSEAAFSHAFKRVIGVSPGKISSNHY
ncbi:AraC family transcriptional regulator [Alginatibacterium sediminis]|uniref:AraC family transcriptional regulator n=1 Tax=Alginatibacterium sediminis TaxID=2164068 RepID=A0A420EDL1_9ALTE|nr:AraC family transcriptional regulator [Alginatibacterium sediminis]RKF18734.1 AraC family transcriptional regulator [Alginatibacterium sediminis]